MFRLSAKMRIVLGLGSMLASVLLLAIVLGIVPDRRTAVLDGRAALCEALAVNSSALVSRSDIAALEAIMKAIVRRNTDILSAAVRRADGRMVVEIGDHTSHWHDVSSDRSATSQVYVPIRAGAKKWGGVEVRFRPLARSGVAGYFTNPWVRLVAFVLGTSLVLWYFYLGKMLQHLDPSKVVPGRVRSALDTLAEGLLVLDNHERIVLANQAFAAWVGCSPDQLLGRRASTLPWSMVDETGDDTRMPWCRAIDGAGRQGTVMMELDEAGYEGRTFMVNCAPVLGQDGNHRGVLVSFEDVTQLEQTKVELSKSRDAAEEANAAKSEFLARMSHEIRTPMNAILGFTDVLLRGFAENEAERSEYLNTIHASGTHLLDLINDILDLSKIEAGRMEVQPVRCCPYELIHQVIVPLRVRAQEKGISLECVAGTSLPETVMTDALRFRQVLTNLIGNAIKFTDTGGVKVVARMDESSGKPMLAVDVIDTGAGMAPEALDRIFDPFAQADASITRRFGGTGLGLSISRRLTKALGGRVAVESELGKGSVFTATFDPGPLDGVRRLDPDCLATAVTAADTSGRVALELPPGRVLVVDDGEANRNLMTLVLRRAGVEVDTATNGEIAVERVSQSDYDVILMDMQMPIMDGYAAASILRQRDFKKPIIALTAEAMKGAEERCRAAGCSGFLTKPIDMDLLIVTLAEALGGTAPRHEPSPPAEAGARRDAASPLSHANNAVPAAADSQFAAADQDGVEQARDIAASIAEINDLAGSVCKPEAGTSELQTPAAMETTRPPRTHAATPPNAAAMDALPLISTLPTEDPEFRAIVRGWVGRLREQLEAMRAAAARRDLAALAQLAHWLKGSGETMGFAAFTAPAVELERYAKANAVDRIDGAVAVLTGLADRIVVPDDEPAPTVSAS